MENTILDNELQFSIGCIIELQKCISKYKALIKKRNLQWNFGNKKIQKSYFYNFTVYSIAAQRKLWKSNIINISYNLLNSRRISKGFKISKKNAKKFLREVSHSIFLDHIRRIRNSEYNNKNPNDFTKNTNIW